VRSGVTGRAGPAWVSGTGCPTIRQSSASHGEFPCRRRPRRVSPGRPERTARRRWCAPVAFRGRRPGTPEGAEKIWKQPEARSRQGGQGSEDRQGEERVRATSTGTSGEGTRRVRGGGRAAGRGGQRVPTAARTALRASWQSSCRRRRSRRCSSPDWAAPGWVASCIERCTAVS